MLRLKFEWHMLIRLLLPQGKEKAVLVGPRRGQGRQCHFSCLPAPIVVAIISDGHHRRAHHVVGILLSQARHTRLRDQKFGLSVQIATSHDLTLVLLVLVVKHVVHLVIYHIVSELFALRTRILLTKFAASENPTAKVTSLVLL